MYDGVVEPYRDLVLGRVDAVLLDLPIAIYYARPNQDLRFTGPPIARGYYAIAFRKDETELKATIDAALNRLIRDGRLRAILETWGLWDEAQEALAASTGDDILTESRRSWTFDRYAPLLLQGAALTVSSPSSASPRHRPRAADCPRRVSRPYRCAGGYALRRVLPRHRCWAFYVLLLRAGGSFNRLRSGELRLQPIRPRCSARAQLRRL
jgi:hypothetical protein